LCGRSASEAGEASAGSKGPSILVAEDNDINALLARALLTRLGHRPTAEALVGDPKTYMIALTANAQTDDRREAVLSAGLDGLLISPLDREHLREAPSTASARAFGPLAA